MPTRRRTIGLALTLASAILTGIASSAPAAHAAKDDFEIHVVCDFLDDLQWGGVYSRQQLQEFIQTFKKWGVSRIYWMADTIEDGTFDFDMPVNRTALETYKQVGEFIPAAIQIAHEAGLEFYVQFKPFDQTIPVLYAHGVPLNWLQNPWRKGIPALGGRWTWSKTWVETHPQFLMARNMTGIRDGIEREPIGTVKIVKNDAQATGINQSNLQLYVSTDNVTYRTYDKPYTFHDAVEERPVMVKGVNLNRPGTEREHVRVLTLSGLEVKEPFLAISTKAKSGAADFANVYYRLIELYTPQDEAIPVTYGPCTETTDYNNWLCHAGAEKAAFPDYGFGFDISGYLGSAWRPQDLLDEEVFLDGHRKILGLAKGKNPYISPLCPAYPEVKRFWLDQVQKFIDWGADGVDFRWPGHQDTMDWVAYGFNEPVVEEYKERYGVDIRSEEFDRDKWRQLMGEHYTDFYRQAKALLAKHGREMQVDVLAVDDPAREPPLQHYCNVYHDWPTWLSFTDALTLRRYHKDFDTQPFRAVAAKYGVPTYYSVWSWMIWDGLTPEQISEKVRSIWSEGNHGLILYETAALYRIKADGTFYQPRPELVQGTLDFKAKLAALRQERKTAADRKRRIIFNNDGDDAVLEAKSPTPESLLAARTTPLVGSQVDAIFYSTHGSFGAVAHRSTVGQSPSENKAIPSDINHDLIAQGTDCLKVLTDFCRAENIEIFWSMRMNDTHEAQDWEWSPKIVPQFKKDHPEYLFGARDRLPKYGFWAAVDYRFPEVRDLAFRLVQEVCRNYDVDGIELDFFRWLQYFKSVADGGTASDEQRALMTDLVRRIRRMTEEESLRRGRPILVAVRVPDSVGYCRAIGLDLERWLADGLFDLFIPAGDFQLRPWSDSVQLGRKYGVKVYCDLDPCYFASVSGAYDRNSIESYRARALDAWQAGADGIYIFNQFNPNHAMWRELGDPAQLATRDKVYFANVTGNGSWHRPDEFLAEGERFRAGPSLHPNYPQRLVQGQPLSVCVAVGDDVAAAVRNGFEPQITCSLNVSRPLPVNCLEVTLNGVRLEKDTASENWIQYVVTPSLVKPGRNQFDIALKPQTAPVQADDESWDMFYRGDKVLIPPQQAPWRRLFNCPMFLEESCDGALLLADQSTGASELVNLVYPWTIAPEDETIVEARVKIVSSSDPLGVCLRLADGAHAEYLTLEDGRIGLKFAGMACPLDTTSTFHTYRVTLKGRDIRVYVDGQLTLDGTDTFTTPCEDDESKLPAWNLSAAGPWPNRCSLLFGSASGPGTGEAYWEYLRYGTQTPTLMDLVMSIRY